MTRALLWTRVLCDSYGLGLAHVNRELRSTEDIHSKFKNPKQVKDYYPHDWTTVWDVPHFRSSDHGMECNVETVGRTCTLPTYQNAFLAWFLMRVLGKFLILFDPDYGCRLVVVMLSMIAWVQALSAVLPRLHELHDMRSWCTTYRSRAVFCGWHRRRCLRVKAKVAA